MASNLQIIINGIDNASGAFGDVGDAMGKLEGKSGSLLSKGLGPLQSMLGTGLKVAAGVAVTAVGLLGAGLASSVNDAADFQQGMADIQASMGASAEDTAKLKQLILDLGIDPKLKVSAQEAAAAIGQLGTAGVSIDDILKGTARSTVLLANATGADFADAASMASDVAKLWSIDAGNLTHAVDGITAATVASKFNINDYKLALAQAGGVASTVGVSFDDFNTTIAAIAPSFASGSDAGTSFKVFLQRLIPQSDKAEDSMGALGLITTDYAKAAQFLSERLGHQVGPTMIEVRKAQEALIKSTMGIEPGTKKANDAWRSFIAGFRQNQFFDANGQMKDMSQIVGVLNKAFSGLTEEQKNQQLSIIFGTDAMRAAAAMAKMTTGDFEGLAATMAKTDAAESAKTRMDTLKGSLEILSGTFDTLKLMVGDKFLPVLNDLVKRFNTFLGDAAPGIVDWAGQLANRLGDLVTNYLPLFITKLGEWWQWAKQLAATVADAAVSVYNFLTNVKAALQPVIDFVARFVGLKEILLGVAAAFGISAVASLASFVAALTPVLALLGTAITVVTALYGAWTNNFAGIRDIVGGVINYLYDRFHLLWDFIKLFGPGALQEIGNWVTGTQTQFTNLSRIWDQVRLTAQVLFNDLVNYVRSSLPGWITTLQSWGAAAWQWIVGAMPTVLAKLQEWASALYGWLVVNLPVWVTKLAAWGISLFQWITDNIPATIDALTKWIDGMLTYGNTTGTSKVQEMLYKLGQAMLTALGAVGISLGKLALTVAGDLLLNFAAGILNWMGIDVSVKSLHDHMIGLIDMLANALSGKAALIGGAIAAFLIPGFASIVSTVVGMVVPALGSLLAGLAALLGPIGLAIAAVVALYVAWQNNFLGIRDLTAQAFDYIKGIFTNFPATLESVKNTLYDWGVSAMGKLREGFVSAQNMVRNGLDVVMDFIQQGRDARMPPFAQSMYEAGANAFFKLGQGAQAVKDGVIGQFNLVMTDIQNQGLGFAGGALLGRMYEGGRGFILQVGAGIASASPNMLTDLNNAFSGLVGKFNYWHDNLAPHFLGSAQDLAAKIGAGFAGFSIGGALDTAFGKLRDAYNYWHDNLSPHFFGSAKDLANSLINGLTSGILDGIGKVIGAIQGVTDALPQWVKDKLGIHSPSTVFQGFGQNIMEGMALGIQQLAAMPQQAIAAATAALTDPLANMQLPQQNGGQQITQNNTTNNSWNVNMPASGGGGEDQFASMFRQLNALYAQ